MAELIPINYDEDVIDDEQKVTAGYFTGNLGTLAATNLTTASKSATQKNYYYDLQYSSEDQFSVAYGHIDGSGSGAVNETKAIYHHFKNLLLDPDDIAGTSSNGFTFGGVSSSIATVKDFPVTGDTSKCLASDMYFLIADRARMKDRLNNKNWSLTLSGSTTGNNPSLGGVGNAISNSKIVLTDDSSTVTGTSTVAGIRYNVVSGSDGSVVAASSSKYYGYIYPDMGIIALRAGELSMSLQGSSGSLTSASIGHTTFYEDGLAPDLTNLGLADNALKFANSIEKAEQKFRSEELQKSKSYFIRTFANDMNFSNNPTFTSGSEKRLLHDEMIGYPSTYITTVGLYQADTRGGGNVLVAVGKLSGPVEKNYGTEATIKVKLTY